MGISAGELDLERPGVNRDAVVSYTWNVDGTPATKVATYNNGVSTLTYTKTFTYTGGQLTSVSKWVQS